MKKILFITHYAGLYGANRSLLDLISRFQLGGFKIWVLAPEKGVLLDELEIRGIPSVIYDYKPYGVYRWKSKTALGTFYWEFRFIIDGLLAYRKNRHISKKIFNWTKQNGIDYFYFNSIMTLGPGFLDITKQDRLKRVLHIREQPKKHFNIRPFLGYSRVKSVILCMDKVVLVSEFLMSDLKFLIPNDLDKVMVIHNCVTIKKDIKNIKIGEGIPFTFGVFGMIGTKKNQSTAIRCFAKLIEEIPDVKLLIVGGGNTKDLVDQTKALGIEDKVDFTGFIRDVGQYYNLVHSCLICSEYEAFGRVTVEALLYEKPVIAKLSGAHPEVLEGGKFGLLYDSEEELIKAMLDVINDYSYYKRKAQSQRSEVKAKYSCPGELDLIVDSVNSYLE